VVPLNGKPDTRVPVHSQCYECNQIWFSIFPTTDTAAPQRPAAQEAVIEPFDVANRRLVDAVHPQHWVNPQPHSIYDLIVIGGGTAGLISAIGAARLGARVALVERGLLGGDCLNVGCIPSKALLRSARAIGEIRRAATLGVAVGRPEPDFSVIMRRMRERRARLSAHDSAERLRQAGIDVFFGRGMFTSDRTISVDGQMLRFNRAVIATGGRPTAPPIPGLDQIRYLTTDTVFSLTDLPHRLLVIGAGPTGCELAQAFVRFGAAVTVFDEAPRVLPNEDSDAAAIVHRQMIDDGITFHLGVRLIEAAESRDGLRLRYEQASGLVGQAGGDRILVASGRTPDIETLGLDAAGVGVSNVGVSVNDRLRTSNARVYAAGDVCSRSKFTHAADAMARVVIENALFFGRRRASALVIPWCTYTDPEVAHVGAYEHELREQGRAVETITIPMNDVDRAVVDDDRDGFVRVHHKRGRLLGCTIVAPHASEMISEVTYALMHRGTLGDLSSTIHPYPTHSEAFRMAGDTYRRSRLTPRVRRWLDHYFRWTR
jgi:pyruvate/2-oxoglutarate dehydrogenase complex dihydrolipoamide dehydrogenase (E3) component